MNPRIFCKSKGTIIQTEQQPTEWEMIFTSYTSNRGLIAKIYKELQQVDIKKINNTIEMGYISKQRILSRRNLNGWKAQGNIQHSQSRGTCKSKLLWDFYLTTHFFHMLILKPHSQPFSPATTTHWEWGSQKYFTDAELWKINVLDVSMLMKGEALPRSDLNFLPVLMLEKRM